MSALVTMRWTSPWIVSGSARPGTNSLNRNSVPIGSGRARLDERAAARDVLGVVGEERVEPLVFDLELDRPARLAASLVARVLARPRLTLARPGLTSHGDRRPACVAPLDLARRSRSSARRRRWAACRCSACSASSSRVVAAVFAAIVRARSRRRRSRASSSATPAPDRARAYAGRARRAARRWRERRLAVAIALVPGVDRRGPRALGADLRLVVRHAWRTLAMPVATAALARRARPRDRRRSSAPRAVSLVRRIAQRARVVASSCSRAALWRFYARAAGVHLQRRSSATSPATCTTRTSSSARRSCGRGSSSSRGWSRSSRWSRRGSTCRRIRVRWLRAAAAAAALGALALARRVALAGALVLHADAGALGYAIDADDIAGRARRPRSRPTHFIIHYAQHAGDRARHRADRRGSRVPLRRGRRRSSAWRPAGKLDVVLLREPRSEGAAGSARATSRWPSRGATRSTSITARSRTRRCATRSRTRSRARSAIRSFGVAAQRVAGCRSSSTPGLIEGLAVALDWPGGYDRLTPHEAVRAMQAIGHRAVDRRAAVAAVLRGVVGARLHDRRLVPALPARHATAPRSCARCISSGGDFEAAYGKSLDDARGRVARDDRDDRAAAGRRSRRTRERFRGGSVFARPCPHAIAARARARGGRARRRRSRRARSRSCATSARDAPEEPRYRLELGDCLAGGDDAERAEARRDCGRAIADDAPASRRSLRAEALERLARVVGRRGDFARGARAARRRRASCRSTPTSGASSTPSRSRSITTGTAGPALRGYFFGRRARRRSRGRGSRSLAEPELGLRRTTCSACSAATPATGEAAAAELDAALALGLPGRDFVENARAQARDRGVPRRRHGRRARARSRRCAAPA